eukprot:SM000060S19598  [mRNA]  locus=s60:72424:78215:+ [translate_table: standard]
MRKRLKEEQGAASHSPPHDPITPSARSDLPYSPGAARSGWQDASGSPAVGGLAVPPFRNVKLEMESPMQPSSSTSLLELVELLMAAAGSATMSFEDLYRACSPHWHRLRRQGDAGEPYVPSGQRAALAECLRGRPAWRAVLETRPKPSLPLDAKGGPALEGPMTVAAVAVAPRAAAALSFSGGESEDLGVMGRQLAAVARRCLADATNPWLGVAILSPESAPALPYQVGVGGAGLDFLASVASFPSPDDKIRTIAAQKLGGGNVANALTAAARLGLSPRILTKVADDLEGRQMLAELEGDGVDTTHVVVAEGGISPFTYIIVDQETKTRTCIHTAGQPPMTASELSPAAIASLLEGADLVFFDGRLPEAAILVAREARERGLPILLDAEKKRDGLDELLSFADFLVASSKFPQPSQAVGIYSAKSSSDMHQAWTGASDLGDALVSTAVRLPRLRFIVVTLGAAGCAMLERVAQVTGPDGQDLAILDAQPTLDALLGELVRHRTQSPPPVLASQVGFLSTSSSHPGGRQEQVAGRILVGGAVSLPENDVVDTTGAGDAFIGSILYGLCAGLAPEKFLQLAAVVLSAKLLEQGQGFPSYFSSVGQFFYDLLAKQYLYLSWFGMESTVTVLLGLTIEAAEVEKVLFRKEATA